MMRISPDWYEWTAAHMDLLARTLIDVMRRSSGHVPAPRGMPFFALDHPAGEFTPYESLAAHGIFRKYESVLMVGAGLGGAARWCHLHFGCDVTCVDAPPVVAAAARLSARTRLAAHTRFLAASADHLPLRAGAFTHAWVIEGLADVGADDARAGEMYRAVRLGGLASLQQSEAPPGWGSAASAAMRSAGFVEVRVREVERPPLRESLVRARERFIVALRQSDDPLGGEVAAMVERVYGRWPPSGGRVTQVFARRPS